MKISSTIKGKVYKYVYQKDVFIKTNITGRSFNNEWLNIAMDGTITVKGSNQNGYAWDGCSPKWIWLDILCGTPDGRLDERTEEPITFFGSMFHDAIYQFKSSVPISRKEADLLFADILKESGFFWCKIYAFAVRVGGGFYGKWHHQTTQSEPIEISNFSWLT